MIDKYLKATALFLLSVYIIIIGCNHPNVSPKKAGKLVNNKFIIAVLPYKDFDTTLLPNVIKEVEVFYNCKIIVFATNDLPTTAFYAPRQRYKADSLLAFQTLLVKNNIQSVVGFTVKDISTSQELIADWGVFGLGYCPGKACVVSTYRLQKSSKTKEQLQERLTKVVLHELGHNLGLPHCILDKECLMTAASGTIQQVDKEKKWLCSHCSQILNK
jgi:archaemetzincin